MRRNLVLLSILALFLVVPVAVLAVSLRNGSPLDHQRAAVRSKPASTTSTGWVNVPGLHGLDVCAAGELSATLSVDVAGAPVEFRVLGDAVPMMKPRLAHFDPSGGTTSFSFTFIGRPSTFEGSDGHLFDAQWRSPTGSPVTLDRGDLNLLFGVGSC